jgi:hypothetical protein
MAKFDKDAFMKALNASLIEQLPRLIHLGQSGFYVYKGERPLSMIARGIASAFAGESQVVELASDSLGRGDAWKMLEPLLGGQTLILIHKGESLIPGRLAAYWPRYARNPHSYLAPITEDFVLGSHLKLRSAGALVVIQGTSRQEALSEIGGDIWPLREKDAEELEKAGRQRNAAITVIGIPPVSRIDLCPDVPCHSEYERAYRIYRRLVNHLSGLTSEPLVATSLANTALRSRDEKQVLLQAQFHDLQDTLESVWTSVKVMRSITVELSGGRHHDDPLPDVYSAALSMQMGGDWICEPKRSLYRGQRNSKWRVIPSLYRLDPSGIAPDVDACMAHVHTFAQNVKLAYPTFSDDQCLAVAQHFGKEARTQTPLIDVTWDALVAIFFASDGAQENDLGVVDHLVIPEWEKLVAASPEERGFIKVIEVDEIQRIARQRALFLAAPDPEAYARYIPYRIWFKQHKGVVFEDEEYDQPISRQSLYPIDSPMQSVLNRFASERSDRSPVSISAPKALDVFGPGYLLARARAIVPAMDIWEPFRIDVLKTCAELLASGPTWTDDPTMYSLHRWNECLDITVKFESSARRCTVKDALKFALWRVDGDKQDEVLALARAIWRRLHGTSTSTVVDHLGKLLECTVRLRMVGAVCFAGSESHIDNVLAVLAKDRRWSLVDLRHVAETEIIPSVNQVQQPTAIVLATDQTVNLPVPLRLLFKTAIDGVQEMLLMRRKFTIHPDTRLFLATWGESFEFENEARHLLEMWDEVDEFDG